MTDTQLRFLRAIGERLPMGRVAELYLFPPMRQGIVETGIAIVAAVRDTGPAAVDAALEPAAHGGPDAHDMEPGDPQPGDAGSCDPTEGASHEPEGATPEPNEAGRPLRHTVFTARYRLTIKGPERGKWELHVVEEADAPLLTVEMVVRGVQHRSGDGADPERLEPAALRELLQAPAA